MKNTIRLALATAAMVMAFAVGSMAQDCRAKTVAFTDGAATIQAKTGGCVKFRFMVEPGQRAKVTLRSSDNKARFDLQDGAEDETGSTYYEGQSSFDKVIEFDEFTIEVFGTSSVGFTLSVKVIDQ